MRKLPSLSSKELVRLLEKDEAVFVRQGSTDHAIYCKRVLRQLKFEDAEIETLLK